jgi:hypothetical protein
MDMTPYPRIIEPDPFYLIRRLFSAPHLFVCWANSMKKPRLILITQILCILLFIPQLIGFANIFIILRFINHANFPLFSYLLTSTAQILIVAFLVAVLYASVLRPRWSRSALITFSLVLTAYTLYIAFFPPAHPTFPINGPEQELGAIVANMLMIFFAAWYAWKMIVSHSVDLYLKSGDHSNEAG